MSASRCIRHSMILLFALAFSPGSFAVCELVDGGKKTPFDGKTLDRVLVEKRSLTILNTEFPSLNVIERTFKGEVQTCSDCKEKHIVCSR